MTGESNPMFGKSPPKSSGSGIKGWYYHQFFRSLRELSYMIFLDKSGKRWETAESSKFRIHYINPNTSKPATYVADFIVEDKLLVECKPKNLQDTKINQAKSAAAEKFCKENSLVYQIIDPELISWEQLFQLIDCSIVTLTERTKRKLDNANNDNLRRASRER